MKKIVRCMGSSFLSLGCLLLVSRTVEAQDAGKGDKSKLTSFSAADLNGDGKISPEEFAIAVRRILAIRDDFSSRGFGLLSKSTQDQLLKDHFDEMDRGKKGFLLPDDWKDNR